MGKICQVLILMDRRIQRVTIYFERNCQIYCIIRNIKLTIKQYNCTSPTTDSSQHKNLLHLLLTLCQTIFNYPQILRYLFKFPVPAFLPLSTYIFLLFISVYPLLRNFLRQSSSGLHHHLSSTLLSQAGMNLSHSHLSTPFHDSSFLTSINLSK